MYVQALGIYVFFPKVQKQSIWNTASEASFFKAKLAPTEKVRA
jgi:hypothetical protein